MQNEYEILHSNKKKCILPNTSYTFYKTCTRVPTTLKNHNKCVLPLLQRPSLLFPTFLLTNTRSVISILKVHTIRTGTSEATRSHKTQMTTTIRAIATRTTTYSQKSKLLYKYHSKIQGSNYISVLFICNRRSHH